MWDICAYIFAAMNVHKICAHNCYFIIADIMLTLPLN